MDWLIDWLIDWWAQPCESSSVPPSNALGQMMFIYVFTADLLHDSCLLVCHWIILCISSRWNHSLATVYGTLNYSLYLEPLKSLASPEYSTFHVAF